MSVNKYGEGVVGKEKKNNHLKYHRHLISIYHGYGLESLTGANQLESCTGPMSVLEWFVHLDALPVANHSTECTE